MNGMPSRSPRIAFSLLAAWLGWAASTIGQDYVTTVPSEGTPPAGATNYERTKAAAGLIVRVLRLLDDRAIDLAWGRWFRENQADIARAMPAKGGVLVRFQIAEQAYNGEGMPRHRYFLSAYIAETGATPAEAESKVNNRPGSSLSQGMPKGFGVIGEWRWIEASKVATPAAESAPTGDYARVERLIAQFDADLQSERARLDLDWEVIQRLNREVNTLRLRVGPKPRDREPDAQGRARADFGREERRIGEWKGAEQRAIATEEAAIAQESRSIHALQQALATYSANWRCPASLTLEVCEQQQNAARDVHLKQRKETRAYRNRQQEEIARRSGALADRQARLTARSGALPRQVETLERNAQAALDRSRQEGRKAADDSEELREKEQESRKRMQRFKQDDEKYNEMERFLEEARRVLRTIPA